MWFQWRAKLPDARSDATNNIIDIKVLGEALGHVDGEDGVLVKVYDDIQTELR